MAEKRDIRALSKDELKAHFVKRGEKAFRATQVYEWLWQQSATTFEDMTNLSKPLREMLNKQFVINAITIDQKQKSTDGTIKCTFRLHDGNLIEGVLIPAKTRMTACVSSQVGCSLSCKFCATGFLKRTRNLEPGEIYDQVVLLKKAALENFDQPLTNIVYMGMGEPLLNYTNVLESVEKITSPEGLGMSPKRITVSTAGIAKMIHRLADDEVKFNLALSLHAANDTKRNSIMAINETNKLEELVDALDHFDYASRGEITFEYILFKGFNDSLQDAEELVKLCQEVDAKVNLIEYNAVEKVKFVKTEEDEREAFVKYLGNHGVIANVRRSRGKDIDAACGQLANKAVQVNQ